MQYCIYLRKSRADMDAEARGEGETLIRHERALLELANRQKLNIAAIYREIVSGETISSRPVMQQLLNEVEQGAWQGVLVMEVERLARGDTIDQGIVAQAFKLTNTKIITPVKTYDPNNEFDEEYFEFGLFMSRREYKTINRRLQRGRIQSVKEGKYLGTTPPYGYNRKKIAGQKGFTLEPHPEQAEIVTMIFDLYTDKRVGVSLIVRKLNELKIPPQRGNTWVPSSIQSILRNPVYIGKIRWNSRPTVKKMENGQMKKERPRAKEADWILVDGLHEPIITQETFDLAGQYLALNPSRPIPNQYTTKNPLSGLITCSVCGHKMVRRPYSGNYPDTLICAVTSCKNVSSHLYLVEERILDVLKDWAADYDLTFNNIEEKHDAHTFTIKAIEKIAAEKKTLDQQVDKLHDLLEQGVYTTERFLERSKLLSEKLQTLNSDLEALQSQLNKIILEEQNKKEFVPKVQHILNFYHASENAGFKNELLKEVIEGIVYEKLVGGRWHGQPDDFTLVIMPKLPK